MERHSFLTKVYDYLGCHKKEAVLLAAGLFTTYLTLRMAANTLKKRILDQKRRVAQESVKAASEIIYKRAVQHESNPERVEYITSMSATELSARLREGVYKPIDVLRCFQIKAIETHTKYNCLAQPIMEAEEWAVALESQMEKGTLYGLPVSIKENLPVKGYDDAQGCAGRLGKPSLEDCVMVEVLKAQGAIPFVRTNMPQLGSSLESSQPIYGQTVNPHDPTRGPGGSSSGESVLLSTGSSPLGFGSDTGGSIRCPAAMCGVTALKPSFSRVSLKGRSDFSGNTIVMSCTSPIARSVDDLAFLFKSMLCPELWAKDQDVAPIPFNDQEFHSRRPLRIGFFTDNGICKAAPACVRAVLLVKDLLREQGHEVIEWQHPDIGEGYWINVFSMCADGGEGMMAELRHDQVSTSLKDAIQFLSLPLWIRKLATLCLRCLDQNLYKYMAALNGTGYTADWWKFVKKARVYKHGVSDAWRRAGLDALVCPAFGVTPLPLQSGNEMLFAASYSMPFNVLDYVAGVVPVTKVTLDDVTNLDDYYPSTPAIYRKIKQGLQGSEGLPVAVQVATPTWRDETCLRVMHDIERATTYRQV